MAVEEKVRSAIFKISSIFPDKHEVVPGMTLQGAVFGIGIVMSDHVFNAVDKIRGR